MRALARNDSFVIVLIARRIRPGLIAGKTTYHGANVHLAGVNVLLAGVQGLLLPLLLRARSTRADPPS